MHSLWCALRFVPIIVLVFSSQRSWLNSSLMCWCVDVLICWWIDMLMLMCWCVDELVCWCVDVLMWWCVDACWLVDVFVCWCVDVLMCDVLMCWCVDVQALIPGRLTVKRSAKSPGTHHQLNTRDPKFCCMLSWFWDPPAEQFVFVLQANFELERGRSWHRRRNSSKRKTNRRLFDRILAWKWALTLKISIFRKNQNF